MNEEELRERIEKGEDIHTEFKEKLPVRGELAKSIVCFANTDGGQIIVGVSDRGEIAGVENLDDAMKLADDVAFNRCNPPITIIQETVRVGDKKILVINVPKGERRPYHTSDGRCYVRATNRCRLASHEELLRLFQATESIYYEESIIYKAAYSDLDLDYLLDFAREYMYLDLESEEIDLKRLLRNLKIMRNEHPTIAGILFFGKKPQNFIPYARIVGAFIKGTDLSIPPSDKKDIIGKIPEMLSDTESFLKLHLSEKHVIEGFLPEIEFEIPEVALREAVVNALAHRDYTVSAPIRIFIFKDRVEIRTPGRLPNTVTIESIEYGGAHVLRNPTIYNFFTKMGMVTDVGSGIFRMRKLVKEKIGKEVGLAQTESEFIVTIPRKE